MVLAVVVFAQAKSAYTHLLKNALSDFCVFLCTSGEAPQESFRTDISLRRALFSVKIRSTAQNQMYKNSFKLQYKMGLFSLADAYINTDCPRELHLRYKEKHNFTPLSPVALAYAHRRTLTSV